ncbi:O-acetyl-ADP-ribose deacetylase [Gorillibacterium sp. sgz5001074]|uniref:O-acetyl-ADP-ribose deacetylase n=1 Tax=Gorillibacterium sp. sgz5001074 TaxID=3446695 RepID=UPI003F67090A
MEVSVQVNQTMISLLKGDITKVTADVIVNAANTSLLGGGGVDGAIHKAGGKSILEECIKIRERQGGCPVGEAVITTAGNLPASYVIHTVGPVWNGGNNNEIEKLKNCYRNSLSLATEHKAKSIAFPNISTGIYRFPKQLAADIALQAVIEYLNAVGDKQVTIEKVYFVCFDEENYEIYRKKLIRRLRSL